MVIHNKFLRKILIFLLVICTVIFSVQIPLFASAETVSASAVLDDLKKDESFNESDFVVKEDDYSINLIQLAESTDKELLVYLYVPSSNLNVIPSSINFSTDRNDFYKYDDDGNLVFENYHNYSLKLLNCNGVFYKYKVENFTVSNDLTRYYSVTSVYRFFNSSIDSELDFDNTITEIAFPVARLFTFSSNNGEYSSSVIEIETIDITDKFVGFLRLTSGRSFLSYEDSDVHFFAFNTDRQIDRLLEVDVSFSYTTCINVGLPTYRYYDSEKTICYDDRISITGFGSLFHFSYSWDSILSSSDFLREVSKENVYCSSLYSVENDVVINDEEYSIIKSKDWVISFFVSDYFYMVEPFYMSNSFITSVSVFRLKFETDGKIFDLGAIDNKQYGISIPVNTNNLSCHLSLLGLILLIVIILILLLIFFPWLIPIIFKVIVWIIALPFKLIIKLVDFIKDKRDKKKNNGKKKNKGKKKKTKKRKKK